MAPSGYVYERRGAYRPRAVLVKHIAPIASYYRKAPAADETIQASCEFDFLGYSASTGRLNLEQKPHDNVSITGEFTGLSKGLHALKVHEFGDLMHGCDSTGDVFNPYGSHIGHSHYDIDGRRVGDIEQLLVLDEKK